MKRICLPVFAVLSLCTVAATRFTPPQVPPSEWADTEAETNLVFDAGTAADNKFTLTIELTATISNNVEVAFGTDADGNGALDFEEAEFIVGWDCGAWFYRDLRTGASAGGAQLTATRNADAINCVPPVSRRRLEWTLYLTSDTRTARRLEAKDGGAAIPFAAQPTFFDPAWNRARVTVRGRDAANEVIDGRVTSQGFVLRVR